MDPQACFDEWRALFVNTDGIMTGDQAERVDELVNAYDGWIADGGFKARGEGAFVQTLTTTGRAFIVSAFYEEWVVAS